jgi:hypothetical protein
MNTPQLPNELPFSICTATTKSFGGDSTNPGMPVATLFTHVSNDINFKTTRDLHVC